MPKAERIPTEWTTARRQVFKAHLETDADTIGVGSSGNRALNIATRILGIKELLSGKSSCIDFSWWVVFNNSGVTK